MKALLPLLACVVAAGCATVDQSLIVLRRSTVVQGPAIGYGGEEGSFSKCYRRVAFIASDSEVRSMMEDPHPSVRLMGFVLALNRWPDNLQALLQRASLDSAEITVVDGCDLFGEKTTVAQLVAAEATASEFKDQKFTRLLIRK